MSKRHCFYILLPLLLFSCSSSTKEAKASREIMDDLGRTITEASHIRKVVSLAPSTSEVISFLSSDSLLIARSTNCNYPETIAALPAITTYPELDINELVQIKCDLVITYDGMLPLNKADKLASLHIPVYYMKADSAQGLIASMKKLSTYLNLGSKADSKIDSLEAAMQQITALDTAYRVLYLLSDQPLYAVGNNTFFTHKIEQLGSVNVIDSQFKETYPVITPEFIIRTNPDLIFYKNMQDSSNHLFDKHPILKNIDAYAKGRIFGLSSDLQARQSPRYVESVDEIRHILEDIK